MENAGLNSYLTPDGRNTSTTTKTYGQKCHAGNGVGPQGNTVAATSKPKGLSRGVVDPPPENISVSLEMAAIVLPLRCRGACSEVPGLRPSHYFGKVNRAMNLTVVRLFLTSGLAYASLQLPRIENLHIAFLRWVGLLHVDEPPDGGKNNAVFSDLFFSGGLSGRVRKRGLMMSQG